MPVKFIARGFRTNAELLHIETKCVPIESPNQMGFVERYHTPIRYACKMVTSEAPDLDEEGTLQIAVKWVNNYTGPDDLGHTLLVYGALPRLGFLINRHHQHFRAQLCYERPPKRCPNTSQKHKYQVRCEQKMEQTPPTYKAPQ